MFPPTCPYDRKSTAADHPTEGTIPAVPLIGRGFPCYSSDMTVQSTYSPDATDWRILDVLQRDGRASFAELARAVSMSASAVTERCGGWRRPG